MRSFSLSLVTAAMVRLKMIFSCRRCLTAMRWVFDRARNIPGSFMITESCSSCSQEKTCRVPHETPEERVFGGRVSDSSCRTGFTLHGKVVDQRS